MFQEIIYQHKKIVYQIFGNGKAVLLVHGFGEDSSIWRNQIDFLKENFLLIIPDLPGSGESEIIDDMSMEGMAKLLKEIIQLEHIKEKINVFGHSMGGYICLAFAEKFPELINSFGLIHSTAFSDSEEKIETRKKGIDFILKYGASEFIKTTTPNLFSEQTQNQNPDLIAEQIQLSSYFSTDALIQYYQQMIARPDRTTILKNSTFPILFIAGEQDKAVPLSDVLKQCHLPDISYFHVLSNSAHIGMLEETDIHNRLLEWFLLRTDD